MNRRIIQLIQAVKHNDFSSLQEHVFMFFSRSKIADFYCFSIDKRQLEKRAPMLNARTTHAFHLFDGKILGN